MRIEKIHIDSFMGTSALDVDFARGVNIIRGDNESGKSTVSEFIKFMLYGAAARSADGSMPERQKYLSFDESSFGGYMELYAKGQHFRIDRSVSRGQSGFRESVTVTDLDKKTQVLKGENPGEALLGIPENVFRKAAYISQEGEAYTGGSDLGAAIENLLFSADETVSTDKALKRLDALRVSLLHKNGKGGKLFELANEREALLGRLEKALGENGEIIAKEGSLGETERRISENKTEYLRAKKLCELYDNYIAHTRFQKLDETKADTARLEEELSELENSFGGFVPDGEYLGRLRGISEQVQNLAMSVATARKKHESAMLARASADETITEDVGSEELLNAVKTASGKRRFARLLFILGGIMAAAGISLLCIVFLMKLESMLYIAAGGALAVGALLIALGFVKTRGLDTLLSAYGVENEHELMEKVKELDENAAQKRDAIILAREKESNARALLENEEKRLADMKETFSREAARIGKSGDDRELFSSVERYIARITELSEQISVLSDRRERLLNETAAYDRESVSEMLSAAGDYSVFEKLDITEYSRKRDFCENAIAALEIKKGELEKSLAALRATAEDPALIKSELDELCKTESETKIKYEAAALAMRSLENASAGLRTRVSPRLAEYAGKLMGVMTEGKYTELLVDGDMALTFLSKGGAHAVDYLSKGTRESAYFALRLALCDLVCKEERLPLVLDECFAHADDKRTKQMLRILMALASEDTQSIVLTCHTRDEKIADTVGMYNLIEL